MKNLSLEAWLQKTKSELNSSDYELVRQAISLIELLPERTINMGLMTAETLLKLNLDGSTLAGAIIHNAFHESGLTIEDIKEHLGSDVAKLVSGVEQMASISQFYQGMLNSSNLHQNIDNIRKMLLAMVDDIRVVLIKIAHHLSILRNAASLDQKTKTKHALETMAIYAPLTNRLGIAQLKWELEDLAFNYLEPQTYEQIKNSLKQRFGKHDQFIKDAIKAIEKLLVDAKIKGYKVNGRIKHVYSIYRKMERKKTRFENIYDVSAIRILVPTVADCYAVLSLVHDQWQYIPEEFDDYIAVPKPNGYRSIHTAVYGPQKRVIEIQVRTYDMHRQAELGIAAHWVYKEGKQNKKAKQANLYQAKLAWLHEVMDWQKRDYKLTKLHKS
jgi:GTP pyrophosphokinase